MPYQWRQLKKTPHICKKKKSNQSSQFKQVHHVKQRMLKHTAGTAKLPFVARLDISLCY